MIDATTYKCIRKFEATYFATTDQGEAISTCVPFRDDPAFVVAHRRITIAVAEVLRQGRSPVAVPEALVVPASPSLRIQADEIKPRIQCAAAIVEDAAGAFSRTGTAPR